MGLLVIVEWAELHSTMGSSFFIPLRCRVFANENENRRVFLLSQFGKKLTRIYLFMAWVLSAFFSLPQVSELGFGVMHNFHYPNWSHVNC